MAYGNELDLLAVGLESTPGTAVTPTVTTRWREVSFEPNAPKAGERILTADFRQSESYIQEISCSIKGHTYLSLPPDLVTVPDWNPMALMSGWGHTQHGTTGQSWSIRSINQISPYTAWYLLKTEGGTPTQKAMRAKGLMGNLKIDAAQSRDMLKMGFEGKAAYSGDAHIANGSLINLGSVNTTRGMQLSGWSATLHGYAARLNSIAMDSGCVIDFIPDQGDSSGTGIVYFRVVSAKPTMTLVLEVPTIAAYDYYASWVANTIGSLILSNQGSGASLFQIRAPRTQLTDPKLTSVHGTHFISLTLECLGNNGSDATMNADDMIEMLHGAKS